METKNQSNQTPEQENIAARDESIANHANETEQSAIAGQSDIKDVVQNESGINLEPDQTQPAAEEDSTPETHPTEPSSQSDAADAPEEHQPVVPDLEELAEVSQNSDETDEASPVESTPDQTEEAEQEAVTDSTETETSAETIPEVEEKIILAETFNSETSDVDKLQEQPDSKPEMALVESKDEHTDSDEDEDEDEDEEFEAIYQNLSRSELVDLIENVVQEPDVQAIKVKVALIKVAFLQKEKDEQQAQYQAYLLEGGTPEEYSPAPDQLSERFQMAFNIYRENKQRYNEELEKQKLNNLEEKKRILEDLKVLINSEETLKKTYDEFKALQDQWKQIGMVPKSEINQLWQNYHFLVEKFFDKVKINKELKDLDLRKNLERKIELCEKAEELLIETSILKSFKQLQQYHEEWKEVGPVPQDKKDEIWERFKIASDQINERRRDYYNKKQGEFENNYLAKTALCEKAEKLVSHNPETLKQWQNRTSEVNELLRVWKTIGPAPKKVNNEIWNRFKTCLDSHFTSYKEFLAKLKEQQLDNYNLKLDLCAQAEAIKNSTDWRNTSLELMRLQKEWKSIGPVPRKHSDKIWKRFRSACDEFFHKKSEYFSSLSEVEEKNKLRKEEMIKSLKEFEFSANRSENLEILKNFQREWLEVGHVPIKDKDRLQNEFRAVINKHFEKLKIDANEISAISYKNRLESIKDKPDAGRMLNRERNALQANISKLQEDVKLWENNIGFLAESKNANILKVEFQKKIDQAKQEVALMEAKLRYLKEI